MIIHSRDRHSGPEWQISFRNCSWGYNAQIWHFCIPLAFLGAKDSKKIIKDRRRSERPNQRPGTEEVKFWQFFHVIMIIWCWLCTDFIIFLFQGHEGQKGHTNSWSGLFARGVVFCSKSTLVISRGVFWSTFDSK